MRPEVVVGCVSFSLLRFSVFLTRGARQKSVVSRRLLKDCVGGVKGIVNRHLGVVRVSSHVPPMIRKGIVLRHPSGPFDSFTNGEGAVKGQLQSTSIGDLCDSSQRQLLEGGRTPHGASY